MDLVCSLKKTGNICKQAYFDFSKKCLYTDMPVLEAKTEYKLLEDKFVRSDCVDDFFDWTVRLSDRLETKGKFDLSDLFINELSKLCMNLRLYDQAQYLLEWSLFNCRQNGDKIHELARLVDLERIFTHTNKKAMFRVLGDKKKCCKEILKDYETYAKNFVSINRTPTSKESVEIQLGITYGNLAKMIEKKKPQDALNMFEKAKDIFQKLGKGQEVDYYETRIKRIKDRLNP